MKQWIFNRFVFLICFLICLTSCETSKPALESYRKKSNETSSQLKNTRSDILKFSRDLIGCKYKAAGKSKRGFDCSGFVIYVFREFQIPMAASSHEQAKKGKNIPLKNATEGDLVFFGSSSRISHVGIITENKKKKLRIIHSTSSKGVIEENILDSDYWIKRIQKIVSLESYIKSHEISFQY